MAHPSSPFSHTVFSRWYKENEKHFLPPICNKLLSGGQLKIMFCGGKKANDRGDYHVEDGEEFFYMIRGSMNLKVVEDGKHKNIEIKQGETFLLPAHIPHSPQRPPNSLGLVIERERLPGEIDAMQWYVKKTGGVATTDVLWRRTFVCTDLGKDLVPIVKAYRASEESKTGEPRPQGAKGEDGKLSIMPLKVPIDEKTKLPNPINLQEWVQTATGTQSKQSSWHKSIYKGSDFHVSVGVCGEGEEKAVFGPFTSTSETYYYQLEGSSCLSDQNSAEVKLGPTSMVIVDPMTEHVMSLQGGGLFVSVSWPTAPEIPKPVGVSSKI